MTETTSYDVYNALTVHQRPKNPKQFTQPSQTIPNQTLSMRELLEKHRMGISDPNAKEPIFQEEGQDQLGIHPKSLDYVEIHEMLKEHREKIVKEAEELKGKQRAEYIAAEQKKFDEAVNEKALELEAARNVTK